MDWLIVLLFNFLLPDGVIRHGIDANLSIALANQSSFSSVTYFTQNGKIKGSCVIIHPQIALTAAHTLNEIVADDLYIELGSKQIKIDSFTIHPWYKINKGADLAILYLSEKVDKVVIPKINTRKKILGKTSISVGYGNFSVANNPRDIKPAGRQKSAGTNIIDSASGILLPNGRLPLVYADFDNPYSNELNKSGDTTALDMEYGLDGGDSGGGMFIEKNGHYLLTGINAFQNKNIADIIRTKSFYGSSSEWVNLAVFRKWIKRKMKEM